MSVIVIHPRLDSFLKNVVGFYPKCIVDVGAHIGLWAKYTHFVYPNSKMFLIEANEECKGDLDNTGLPYTFALLGDEEGKKKEFYCINGGDSSGNSVYRERTSAYNNGNCHTRTLTTTTLDNILDKHKVSPDFIKIDVQGAELDVLRGARNTLKKVEFIMLEVQVAEFNQGAPTFFEIMKYMDKKGFELFDVIEMSYIPHSLCLCRSDRGRLNELDLLFIRKDSEYKKKVEEKVGYVEH
jgi:FkbM family methyltransferase